MYGLISSFIEQAYILFDSKTHAEKNLTIDERNLTSTQWVEYHIGTKRKSYTPPANQQHHWRIPYNTGKENMAHWR